MHLSCVNAIESSKFEQMITLGPFLVLRLCLADMNSLSQSEPKDKDGIEGRTKKGTGTLSPVSREGRECSPPQLILSWLLI